MFKKIIADTQKRFFREKGLQPRKSSPYQASVEPRVRGKKESHLKNVVVKGSGLGRGGGKLVLAQMDTRRSDSAERSDKGKKKGRSRGGDPGTAGKKGGKGFQKTLDAKKKLKGEIKKSARYSQ